MTSNILDEGENKDLASNVNYSKWTTGSQPPKPNDVTNKYTDLKKWSLSEN